MKTKLKSFCSQFSNVLDPFLSRLDSAIDNLNKRAQEKDLSQLAETVEKLQDVRNRALTLQTKIANQHAYMLIFGPLKSGKSTLMNAISGAYVSEVSSLPTYPALVYVKDGEQNRFRARTYDDAVREFSDSVELKAAIQEEYNQLAAAILEAEKSGRSFDPEVDHPQAIRQVDVELPARNLAESGTVLVDTPGLYSRMKFGYDQMTKDFRDTAACAIFVVKTDDLFFEKVFEEFEELLGYFSRIFLVSNVDSSKQDLQPDGSLNDSLEASAPEKVIEAFQSLSISANLQQAITDGRLNIYSIDLLKAASRRLRDKPQASTLDAQADLPDALTDVPTLEEADLQEEQTSDDGFDDFLEDLTNYLNSIDYLSDFMTDTLKAANELLQEEVQQSTGESIDALQTSCDELAAAINRGVKRGELLAALEKTDWSAGFGHVNKEKKRLLNDLEENLADSDRALEDAIDAWLQSDESWQELFTRRLNPALEQTMKANADHLVEQLRVMLDSATGGARFDFDLTERLAQAGVRLDSKAPQLVQGFALRAEVPVMRLEMKAEDVPVNVGLLDKLMMRNAAKVRLKLFGADGGQPVAAAKKQARLEGRGVEHIRDCATRFMRENLPGHQREYANKIVIQYLTQFRETLENEIKQLKSEIARDIRARENSIALRKQALEELNRIREASTAFSEDLTLIKNQFDFGSDTGVENAWEPEADEQFDDSAAEGSEPESAEDEAEPEDFELEEACYDEGEGYSIST